MALGGAKNHLVVLPDADFEIASNNIIASFAGCTGQRCMAASVLILVGDCNELVNILVEKVKKLKPGQKQGQVGPVIDLISRNRINSLINNVKNSEILVDGRDWLKINDGYWFGPTLFLHNNKNNDLLNEEIFVLYYQL